jgi:hypothetical protein
MPLWQRLNAVAVLLSFSAIEFCRRGVWRHVFTLASLLTFAVVIWLMVVERRRRF